MSLLRTDPDPNIYLHTLKFNWPTITVGARVDGVEREYVLTIGVANEQLFLQTQGLRDTLYAAIREDRLNERRVN